MQCIVITGANLSTANNYFCRVQHFLNPLHFHQVEHEKCLACTLSNVLVQQIYPQIYVSPVKVAPRPWDGMQGM